MKVKYCLPIIKKRKQDVIEMIEDNVNNFDYFEVWLDYIEDQDNEFIKKLIQLLGDRLILLFRRKELEPIKLSLNNRFQIISLLDDSNSLLDLDITTQKEELDYIESHKLTIKEIVTYHNYGETPANKKLNEIVDIITKYDPGILKIATMCKIHDDGLRLLKLLLHLKTKNIKYIISGMGENGKITKIFGAMWGNEMTFAPISSSEQSAPGQLTKEQIESVLTIIHNS